MAQALNRKAQIRKAAQHLFKQQGYSATSMRDLAKKVGIEAASLYSHVPSKSSILEEICFRIAQDFLEANGKIVSENLNPTEKLSKAIENHILVIAENLDASSVFFHDWKYLPSGQLQSFIMLRRKYENIFQSLLAEGKEKGDFDLQNPKLKLRLLLSTLNSIHEWYDPKGKLKPIELAQQIFESHYNGIAAKK